YYDAFNIRFLGGTSWRSRALSRVSENQNVYFVGDELTDEVDLLRKSFFREYGKSPGVVEMMGFSAAKITFELLQEGIEKGVTNRADFERLLTNRQEFRSYA